MNRFKLFAFGLSFLWLAQGSAVAAPAQKVAEPDIKKIFEQVDAHYDRLQNISFKVQRHLQRGLQNQDERWQVTLRKPDAIRIDYVGPPERIVLAVGDQYSEYIPEVKKALELSISKLTEKGKESFFAALMPRVAIPGFRLSIPADYFERMDFRVVRQETFADRPSYAIEGTDKGKKSAAPAGKVKIWIDRERLTLLKLEIYDGDHFVSSIENRDFREYDAGRWLPGRIHVQTNTPKSLEQATYYISKMAVNQPLGNTIFEKKYAAGVKVISQDNPTQK